MTKEQNLKEWTEICIEFCRQKGYKLLFVNDTDFGYEDQNERLHHVYTDELVGILKGGK